jgi:hypothetical protein
MNTRNVDAGCLRSPRVEQPVAIRKNAAQASDTSVGQGTQRPLKIGEEKALGRRLFFEPTLSRARVFPGCVTRWAEQIACVNISGS